jgi:hypothetical protein
LFILSNLLSILSLPPATCTPPTQLLIALEQQKHEI